MALEYALQMAAAGYVVAVETDHLVMIGEKAFPLPAEVAPVGGGWTKVVRYAEYSVAGSSPAATVLVFKVIEAEEADSGRYYEEANSDSYYEEATGTWDHVVNVQTDHEALMVLVSVREHDNRIVGIRRF